VQRTETSTGIEGVNTQDIAIQEGMGPIVDRSREYLGTSDKAIIAMRKLLMEATQAVERGEDPPGIDPAVSRGVRAFDCVVPPGMDWREVTEKQVVATW